MNAGLDANYASTLHFNILLATLSYGHDGDNDEIDPVTGQLIKKKPQGRILEDHELAAFIV